MFDQPLQSVMSEQQFLDIRPERCAFILRLLDEGWKRISGGPDVNPDAGEVEITECLRDSMREVLKGELFKWRKRIWVLEGTESRSTPHARRPAGIPDIPISFSEIREEFDDHDPHAMIECKRMAGSCTDLCRRYVVDGIDRFKTGKYASSHVLGFMAGYLLSDGPQSATHGINRYLTGKRRRDERLESSTICDELWAKSSVHERPALKVPITLHHAFLSFRQAPS